VDKCVEDKHLSEGRKKWIRLESRRSRRLIERRLPHREKCSNKANKKREVILTKVQKDGILLADLVWINSKGRMYT